MLGTGLLGRALGAAAPPLMSNLRMAQVMLDDVARALDPLGVLEDRLPEDWLDARDPAPRARAPPGALEAGLPGAGRAARAPAYIGEALPALRAWSALYFRAEVEGLEEIPADEPVLLVGNHSGGTLIADTFVFSQHFADFFGPQRLFHQLAHDLVFQVPGVRASLSRFGTVPASPDNMRRALERGAALLVYPGGDHETYRPTWQQARIDFAGRTGFAKLALELDTPIAPVVAIGGQETALFLGRGGRISQAPPPHKALPLQVFPLPIRPPFRVTPLHPPPPVPPPAHIT